MSRRLILDIESLSDSDSDGTPSLLLWVKTSCRVSKWSDRRVAGTILGAALALAGCCLAAAFQSQGSVGEAQAMSRHLQSTLGLQELPQTRGDGSRTPTGSSSKEAVTLSNALNTYLNTMMGPAVRQKENHNAHRCMPNEEEFESLCYMKCALLTNGSYPLRTSAWTCCQAEIISDCFIKNQDHDVGFCSGYDVSGDGSSCPRTPGKCLLTEELFFGECYEKCSILTKGTHPHRTSGFSCCDTTGTWDCFKPSHVWLSSGYIAGGGKGDGDKSTPAYAHQPLKRRLAEWL